MTRPLDAAHSDAHLPAIDVLRGLAAFAVVVHHVYGNAYGWAFNGQTPYHWLRSSPSAVKLAFAPAIWGNAGVPVFFLLSGFCIHLSHLRRPAGFTAGRFYARRFWRLYPAYLASMLVILAVNQRDPATHTSGRNIALHLALVHNLVSEATFRGINPPYWSLAVEWQYYLAYPLVVLWCRRFALGTLTAIAGVASVCLALGLSAMPSQWIRLLVPFGFFPWCLGAWLARRYADGRPALVPAWAAVAGAAAVVAAVSDFPGRPACEWYAWALLGTGVLEAWVRRGTRLAVRPLVWLGAVSYSLYLWHFWFVTAWAVPAGHGPAATFALAMTLGGAASVAAAAASYYAVERPGVALGRRLLGRPASAAPSLSAAAAP